MTKNAIICHTKDKQIFLDPKHAGPNDIHFVSHAHTDHLPSKNGGIILTSQETAKIAKLRGVNMENHTEHLNGFVLVDSGHVLGARGLLFNDMFYTGDICTRDRGFLRGAKIPKCRTLITECTFGLPEFSFPDIAEIQQMVNETIAEMYGKGIPVVLLGYSFGKAQMLTHLFGHWGPLYLHDSIKIMNSLHQRLGVRLKNGISHTEAETNGLLDKKPWLMIAPPMPYKSQFLADMRRRGAITIGFSGWARSKRFHKSHADYIFPLSDHCDFAELVDMVVRSGAENVYTTHGFAEEFAQYLRNMGISAKSLNITGGKIQHTGSLTPDMYQNF